MTRLHPLLARQTLFGLLLCVSSIAGLVVEPSHAGAVVAFLTLILFLSQLAFAKAHMRAARAQAATRDAFAALPDAVVVVNAQGSLEFCKDFLAPQPPVLPALVADGRLSCEPLSRLVSMVSATRKPQMELVQLPDRRFFECRASVFSDSRVLVIVRDVTESHNDSEKVRYLATHDSLTGLLNRNSFHVALEQAIARANRSKKPLGLLFLDLDHFKAVNDALGHQAGDELLRKVASRTRSVLRQSDSAYRLAGDEFTVLIEQMESEESVLLVAEKLRVALAEPYFTDPSAPQVTASIGAVVYPRDGAEPDELIRLADNAMYRAKALGRNTITKAPSVSTPTSETA